MKFVSCKYFSLLALFCIFASSARAERYAEGYADYQDVECRTRCNNYECGCNPLYCGALDFQVHAGALPILWHDRGQFSFIQCAPQTNPIVPLFAIPKFSRFFSLPWTVGAQFGLALSDNVRVYFEFDYSQASGKRAVALSTVSTTPTVITFTLGKYQLYDLYFGARYYFDRWCNTLTIFLGFKAGLVHHNRLRYSSTITPPVPVVTFTDKFELMKRNTVPSGGLEFGFDYCYCGNWSFELAGAILASCGPKSVNAVFNSGGCSGSVVPVPVPGVQNFIVGGIGAELRFPVTIGVRYTF